MSPVSADHQTRSDMLFGAVLSQPHGRGISGNDTDHFRRSPQLDVRLDGLIEQALLHLRMIEVQTPKPRRRRLNQVPIFFRRGPPPRFMCAVLDQPPVKPKISLLGRTPGLHSLSPNSIAELRFRFGE